MSARSVLSNLTGPDPAHASAKRWTEDNHACVYDQGDDEKRPDCNVRNNVPGRKKERKQRGMNGCALTKDQRTCNEESDHCSDDERRRLRQQVKVCTLPLSKTRRRTIITGRILRIA
jgi:hypothetical protein